jgi:hypothetical protein
VRRRNREDGCCRMIWRERGEDKGEETQTKTEEEQIVSLSLSIGMFLVSNFPLIDYYASISISFSSDNMPN